MVDKRNIGTRRPLKKLDHKMVGLFPITKAVGKRTLHMQLREGSQAHSTFHVQLLEPYRLSHEVSRRQRPPTPEQIEGDVNYIVREIVESHKNNKKKRQPIEYLVL